MGKRFALLLAGILFLYSMVMTAFAQEVPDFTKKGSIEITMQREGKPVTGGDLTLFKVGEIKESDGNYSFVLAEEFQESKVDLKDLGAPEPAEKLAAFALKISGNRKDINQDGYVKFEDLEPGLYLLLQENAADGYEKLSPFLVSLPEWVNGTYLYQVKADPKVQLVPKVTSPPQTTPNQPSTPTPTPVPTPTPEKLPQTGQLNWPIPFMAVLGLGLFLVGWKLRYGYKEGQE